MAPSTLDLAARKARQTPGAGDYNALDAFKVLAASGSFSTKGNWGDSALLAHQLGSTGGGSLRGSLGGASSVAGSSVTGGSSLVGSFAESAASSSTVASRASSRFRVLERLLHEQASSPGPASYQQPPPRRPLPARRECFSTLPLHHELQASDRRKSKRKSMLALLPADRPKSPPPPPPTRGHLCGALSGGGFAGAPLGPGPYGATVGFLADRHGRLGGPHGSLRLVESKASKTDFDLLVERAAGTPGPCDYGRPTLPAGGGGKFNTSTAKTDLEWAIHRAKRLPGPGQHDQPGPRPPGGGRFNMSNSRSEIEWVVFRAAGRPGPGTYETPALDAPSGGAISKSSAKSELERIVAAAASSPGPGYHDPNVDATGRFKSGGSGKFVNSHHPVPFKGSGSSLPPGSPVNPRALRLDEQRAMAQS